MRTALLAMVMAASTAGCGQAEASFDKEFDTNFRASCVSAAVSAGAPDAVATQVCDCTLAGINANFSRTEKLALSPERAQPIAEECLKKAGQQV